MEEVLQDQKEHKLKIREAEKQAKKNKKIREVKAIAGFTVAYFFAFYFLDSKPSDFIEFAKMVLVSLILASVHFAVNSSVFEHIHSANKNDQEIIKQMKENITERW